MIKSIVKFSQLEDRFDAEYYKPEYLMVDSTIGKYRNYKKLGELTNKIVNGAEIRTYYTTGVPYLRVSDIKPYFLETINVKYVHKTSLPKADTELNVGDVLLSRSGSIGIAAVATEDLEGSIISSHIIRLALNNLIDPYYLVTFLNSKYGHTQLLRRNNGAVVPEINQPALKTVKVPVLSSIIQKQIRNMLLISFRKKNQSEQKYQEAQSMLSEYLGIKEDKFDFPQTFSLKFSELDDRFDGEFYQPKALSDSPIFDKGTTNLGEITSIKMGKTPSKQSYTSAGVRMLKVRDLTNKGIDWSENNRAFTNCEAWDKSEKARVQEDDILLISAAHQAYYIGKELDIVFDIPEKYDKKLLAVAEILIIRPSQKINPYVLLWYLRTPIAYKFIQRLITGETSHLYPKDLITLPVPKKLLDYKEAVKIERLTKESILLKKESKRLLDEAKRKVEEMIEKE